MLWLTVCIWGLVIALMATGNNAHVHQQDVGRDSLPWSTSRRQLVVPMEIQVVFLGLNGEADQNVFLDSESFVQVLERSLEATQAFSVQDQRGINVQYEFNYAATHAPRTSLVELSQILGQAFPARMRSPVCNKVTVPCGPDTAVTKFFDALYFDTISSQTTQKDMPSSYTVFVVNPSAAEILKVNHDEVLPFTYAYQYDGAAADSQSWIGRERYVVIDIGAGPVSLGSQEGDSSGGVGAWSFPALDYEALGRQEGAPPYCGRPRLTRESHGNSVEVSVWFSSRLSALVISAIQHVFASDMLYSDVQFAEKIIVPIVALRNHDRFSVFPSETDDPIDQSLAEFKIDLAAIEAEIKGLLLDEQDVVFVPLTYDLINHHHIAASIHKATTNAEMYTEAPIQPHRPPATILDSVRLLHEMRHNSDQLTRTLFEAATSSTGASVKELLSIPGQDQTTPNGFKPSTVRGHKYLPVFVFSLLGLPSDLLFDGARNMVADSEMVLVLQTGADTVHTPYQSNSRHVQLNLRKPTQAIMAGIVSALGGVAPPHLNYHPSQGRLVAEYEWACGHHPFGPFSQTQGVSLILRDTMLRNNMLSLLTHSLHQMRAITEQLETIMRPFVAEPLGTQSSDLSRAGAVLELLSTTDEDSRFYIPDVTPKIAKLLSESEFIESRFTRVSNLLETHQWKEAHLLARSIFASSDAFVRYFQAEIDSLRDHMQCCVKQYTFTNAIEASTSYSSYLVQLATVAVGLVLLWFAAKKRTQKNKYDRR